MEVMQLPKFYGLIKVASIIGAVLGCLSGSTLILTSMRAFNWGFVQGLIAISSGVIVVVSTLLGLGLILCFLSMVQAQIDTRNMTLKMLNNKNT
ncbi:hypothetical protein [Shewanella halifaxensis]|uniref:hypothetical protein n=1 Tax=Shewanella halifaxensis TaxID=271098 RepID=UPI00059D9213|nr:hypothetical protein [Shewanella halifaxensis]